MAKYVVEKEFRDRLDGYRHCRPGDPHVPPNEDRAKSLLDQGFISVVAEDSHATEGKTSGRTKKPKQEEIKLGDEDGEAPAGE